TTIPVKGIEMIDAAQKATRTAYTKTVALLVVAFFFSPAIVIASRPVGYVFTTLAAACSVLCVAWAWVSWKKPSQIIPSIVIQRAATQALWMLCVVGTSMLYAGDLSTYRGLQFGMNLSAAKTVGAKPAEARMVHQLPAVIQEMDW